MSKIQWSLVCPVKDEVDLLAKTFPSFYAVNPSEVIFCFDNPPHKEAYEIAKKIADKHKNVPTKFLFVDRNPEFAFHQAWVRARDVHDHLVTYTHDVYSSSLTDNTYGLSTWASTPITITWNKSLHTCYIHNIERETK